MEYCSDEGRKNCKNCPIYKVTNCFGTLSGETIDLINRQQAEIDRLELVLLGVMHFVDKWLDGAELEQDEVSKASTMREKTLQIVEKQQAEIEQWKEEANKYQRLWCIAIDDVDDIETAQSEAIKEFAERLKEKVENVRKKYQRLCREQGEKEDEAMNIHFKGIIKLINNLVKEYEKGR